MLDLVRVVVWGLATIRSLRARSVFCAACAALIGCATLVTVLDVAAALQARALGGVEALALFFLGTGFIGGIAHPGVPGSEWASRHPRALLIATSFVAVSAALHAWRRAKPLPPHTVASRRWDAIGLSFLLLAVIDGILVVSGCFMDWGVARTSAQ